MKKWYWKIQVKFENKKELSMNNWIYILKLILQENYVL